MSSLTTFGKDSELRLTAADDAAQPVRDVATQSRILIQFWSLASYPHEPSFTGSRFGEQECPCRNSTAKAATI